MIEGVPLKEGKHKGGRARALAGFLAFVLGVSLTVSSLGNIGNRIVWERDLSPRFTEDWQETDRFRMEVASYLKAFLTIGAGGRLDVYPYAHDYYVTSSAVGEDRGTILQEAGSFRRGTTYAIPGVAIGQEAVDWSSAESAPAQVAPEWAEREPDADYQNDKNVLYWIQGRDGKSYTNCDLPVILPAFRQGTIAGCNFFLVFQDGKVTIRKDGQELDVYGDGVYDGGSRWFVPGYDNFPATDQLDGVTVCMAVRETPIRYHYVDYKNGSTSFSSSMYYIARQVEESREFYRRQAVLLAAGLAYLVLWLFLRKSTVPVDRKIASWTVHVWTEVRFLLVFLPLALWLLAGLNYYSVWDILYILGWNSGVSFSDWGLALLRLLTDSPPVLLALVWFIWLIYNDHHYNPKECRGSLLRKLFRILRNKELKYPIQKRLVRRVWLTAIIPLVTILLIPAFLILTSLHYRDGFEWLPVLFGIVAVEFLSALLYLVFSARRTTALALDIGLLTDQINTVRNGDLSTPLVIPEDADLRAAANALNDIQAGMRIALEEQTRSERMKVELVSNVSHDLKTPLTSILSYAELLRQEDLPPAAADYARVIDEKAQRLKGMVEDVFEVSRAAADQLPVRLEKLDLAKLLRQTLADMDGPIQNSALTFKIDLPEAPVMITADGKRLYRVFQNLIDNALRYALEGSRVYLALKTAESQAEVSVRNTSRVELPEGVDFTARFVRGDASRTDGGSGLGLSIASSFTEACGGTFRVETVADLFTAIVTFPISND